MTILDAFAGSYGMFFRLRSGRVAGRKPAHGVLAAVVLACSAFICPTAELAGQTAETQASIPVLRLNARQVLVDVVVTGRRGKPVTGLHKEDFQVFEDGSSQAISSFEEHTGTQSPEGEQSQPGTSDPNLFTNVPQVSSNGSLLILLLDSLNTPEADQSRVRGAMLKYLQGLPPGRQIAIFTLGSELRCIHGFTGDASVLTALVKGSRDGVQVAASPLLASKQQSVADKTAVAQIADSGHGSAQDGFGNFSDHVASFQQTQASLLESGRKLTTLEAFLDLAHYLSGIPGRKSVAWFSGSFPHVVYSASEATDFFKAQRDYSEKAKATEAALEAARVAIYPIAAGGLDTGSFFQGDTQLTSHKPMDAQQETHDSLAADGKVRNDAQASMDEVAQATGGVAIYNTNDLSGAVERVADEGSHYYTLFYTPTSTAAATQYRKIVVKLASSHDKLAYTRGYYVKPGTAVSGAEATPADDPLASYLRPEALDSTQIPLDLKVALAGAPDKKVTLQGSGRAGAGCVDESQTLDQKFSCYTVRFNVRAGGLQFDSSQDGLHLDSLELRLLVFDKNGKTLNGITSKVNLKLDDARYRYVLAHGTHLELEIGVPKDGVSLRGGVYDRNSGYAGTLKIALASVVNDEPAAAVSKVAVKPSATPAKMAVPEVAKASSVDPLAESAGIINAREDAVAVALPQPAVEAVPVEPEIPVGKSAAAARFWTLPPGEVNRLLSSSLGDNSERYARLRADFTKFGCTGSHLSEEREKKPGQNLICLLPGTESRTIVVTAHYEHRENEAADAQDWNSAILLVRLYKALQAEQRHYSFVFVALGDDAGEKQFLSSLGSADLQSLVAVVALDVRAPGQLDYVLSQAVPHASMQGLVTDDEALRAKAIRNGEETKKILASTLTRSAQINRLGPPLAVEASRGVANSQLVRHSTYIPSILIYTAGKPRDVVGAGSVPQGAGSAGIFDVLGAYLCGLDTNLATQ